LFCHIASSNYPSLGLFRKLGFTDASARTHQQMDERFGEACGPDHRWHVLRLDLTRL
jgi:hypothetical protein